MSRWLAPLDGSAQMRGGDDPRAIGGKASRLVWLIRNAFDVPEAVVLPAEVFGRATRELPSSCEPRALLRAAANRAGSMRAAEARQRILGLSVPEGLQAGLA